MHLLLTFLAAGFGAATGLLLPRAVFRLSVEPEDPWRPTCPQHHPWPAGPRGWLGPARCARCSRTTPATAPPAVTKRSAADAGHTATAGAAEPSPAAATVTEPASDTEPDATVTEPASDTEPAPDTEPDATVTEPAPDTEPEPAPAAKPVRRWPLALVAAVCCALLAHAVGGAPELAVWLLLVPGMVAVTAVDIAVLRLPDVLTLPLAATAVAGLGLVALLADAGGSWPRALLAGAVLSGGLLVLALISPQGMGLGDVKLALALGVALGWYGWDILLGGVFAGFLLAMFFASYLVIARGAGRRTAFSMGPFLAAGTLAGVLLGGLSS